MTTRYKITCTTVSYYVVEGNLEQAVEEMCTLDQEGPSLASDHQGGMHRMDEVWDVKLLAPLDPVATDLTCEYQAPKPQQGDERQIELYK